MESNILLPLSDEEDLRAFVMAVAGTELFFEDGDVSLFVRADLSGSCIYWNQVDDHEDLRGECGSANLFPALAYIERACRPSDHVVFVDGVDHIDMASCGQTVEGEARD